MVIAKVGRFKLQHKTFFNKKAVHTHDLEIVATYDSDIYNSDYTIATFDNEGQIISCGYRLLDEIDTVEELDDIKTLAEIANSIITKTDLAVVDKNDDDEK